MLNDKKKSDREREQIYDISQQLNIPFIIAEVLFERGLKTEQEIVRFYDAMSIPLNSPFLMPDMQAVVERINSAIDGGETIVIYSDYDADGICSAVMLYKFLHSKGNIPAFYIPSRQNDGYGLHMDAIEFIAEEYCPDLIITCDCGISAAKEVEYIQDLGIDVIVTDHHELPEELPKCLMLNSKIEGYPFSDLCGAGVVLKLIEAMDGNADDYLDVCAIATVADLVPLVGENRTIAARGLELLNQRKNKGIRMLLDELNIAKVTSSDIAFRIAPRINAAGRMGDAKRALLLFISEDEETLSSIIYELKQDNENRKILCDKVYCDVLEKLKSYDITSSRAILLADKSWEKGIIGIVCARVSKEFNRPTILISLSGNHAKATVRGISGVNVYDMLCAHSDYLIEYGGHAQAAGFSIYEEDIPEFCSQINSYLAQKYDRQVFFPDCSYDAEIDPNLLTLELAREASRLEPFGQGNPRPTFLLRAGSLNVSEIKNGEHLLINLGNTSIPAFNQTHLKELFKSNTQKLLSIDMEVGSYKGECLKVNLRNVFGGKILPSEDLTLCQELSQFAYTGVADSFTEYSKLCEVPISELYGTAVLTFDYNSYLSFYEEYPEFVQCYFSDCTAGNFNKVIFAPRADFSADYYDTAVLLERPHTDGYIRFLRSKFDRVFVPALASPPPKITCNRDVLLGYYSLIKQNERLMATDFYDYVGQLKQKYEVTYSEMMLAILVFSQLEIVKIFKKPYNIRIDHGKKAELDDSPLYRLLNR